MAFEFTGGASHGGGVPGVPEPATWAMMLLGVGAIGAIARTRRAAALKGGLAQAV